MKYRVVLKVGYNSAFFEFSTGEEATKFAAAALEHATTNEDTDKPTYVAVHVVMDESEDE